MISMIASLITLGGLNATRIFHLNIFPKVAIIMLVCHEDFHTITKCFLKGIWTAICLFFGINNRLLQSYFKEHYYAETCTMPHFMLKPHPLKRLHLLSEVRNLRVLPMISPISLGKLAMLGLLKMIYFNPGNWTWFDFGMYIYNTHSS